MKWLVVAVAVVVVMLASVVPLSGFMVRKGLENPGKSWAPGLTQKGARLRMIFGNYEGAALIWERAANTWPQHPDCAKMVYRVGFCYEQAKKPTQALAWYNRYLSIYPQHMWAEQARRRVQNLTGGES